MGMRQVLRVAAALILALSLVGCFDYAERIELNADGSGTLVQHMVLSKDGLAGMMQMMQALDPDTAKDSDSSMFSFIKRADIEKKLAESKSDTKLLDFKEIQTESTTVYDIKYSFANLDAMMQITSNMNMGESDMMGNVLPKKQALWAKDDKGNWNFSREFGDSSTSKFMNPGPDSSAEKTSQSGTADSVKAEDPFGGMGKMMEVMIKQAFANHTVKLTVKFPGTIVESNATAVSGSEATWNYKLVDLVSAKSKVRAVVKL
jgi:hypothetical protein